VTATGEYLVEVLADAGIEHVIGVPGGGTRMTYTAMHGREGGPQPVLARHEHGAAVMADAYARATGRPAVIMGQGAFIVANGAFGLMEALTSSSPVILVGDFSDAGLTPRPVAQSVNGDWGSPDAVAMLRGMTKYTAVASTPTEAVVGLQLAIKHAVSGCPGPTALMIKSAALSAELTEDPGPPVYLAGDDPRLSLSWPPAGAVERALQILSEARNPVIVAGKGVHNAFAHAELRTLAERWGLPVATTYKGKSAIPETHPLALGMVGIYGHPVANELVRQADVVLVVGAKLRSKDTSNWSVVHRQQRIIQIDIETLNAGWALPAEVTLIGDARTALEQILAGSDRFAAPPDLIEARKARVREVAAADTFHRDPSLYDDTTPVLPQRVARVLEEHLHPSTNISLDAGNNRVWMGLFCRAQRTHSLFAPGGLSGMGWAMPAALGVKLARPDEPSVAVTGDGGFMMSAHALATAADLPTVTVVFNDSGLGMVRQHQGDRVIASSFPDVDHAAIARGFGLAGFRVTHGKDLPEAIRAAQSSGTAAVIDVVIDDGPSPDVFRTQAVSATET
jgi:acetolactate synthase-1/2/3 large subunit